MEIRHLYKSQQFDPDLLSTLFDRADELQNIAKGRNRQKLPRTLDGRILASIFFQPSTRTRFSFESAIKSLGGDTITTENAEAFSSFAKGESIEDMLLVVGGHGEVPGYADVAVIRHKERHTAKKASEVSAIPVINAGDGPLQHPTQALLDAYTIQREIGKIDDLKIAMVGDLKNGRTVRSLCYLLGKYDNVKVSLVSPHWLAMEDDILAYMKRHDTQFKITDEFEDVIKESDIIYMTRIQDETGSVSKEEFAKAEGMFAITDDNLHLVKEDARIMHPLPHRNELSISHATEVIDPRVAYFREASNGLYARMALLEWCLHAGPFAK